MHYIFGGRMFIVIIINNMFNYLLDIDVLTFKWAKLKEAGYYSQ